MRYSDGKPITGVDRKAIIALRSAGGVLTLAIVAALVVMVVSSGFLVGVDCFAVVIAAVLTAIWIQAN